MIDTPRWLRLLAGAAVAMLLVAVVQPAVGALLLHMFVIGTFLALGDVTLAEPLRRLQPASGRSSRRGPRVPATVPRELEAMAGSLRATRPGDRVPEQVLAPLRASLERRLRDHRGLVPGDPAHAAAIGRVLSGDARALLATAPGRTTAIARDDLAALVAEIESL